MKNGKCPHCGTTNVYSMPGGLSFGNMDKIYIDGPKLHQPSSYTAYVCATCGYYEVFLSPVFLPEIAKNWTKVPPKG